MIELASVSLDLLLSEISQTNQIVNVHTANINVLAMNVKEISIQIVDEVVGILRYTENNSTKDVHIMNRRVIGH